MQQKLEWFVEPAGGIQELLWYRRVCLLWLYLGIVKASRCGNERQQLSSRRKLAVGKWRGKKSSTLNQQHILSGVFPTNWR